MKEEEMEELKPCHDDGSPAPEDNIAKAKRILRAVDLYHEAPNASNRTELRRVIYAQLEAAAAPATELVASARKALDECVDLIATPAGEALETALAKQGA
jgi:hypothetical protein